MVTAACYEHRPIIGRTPGRMAEMERELLEAIAHAGARIQAWVLLPNHYHVLFECPRFDAIRAAINRTHGRNAFRWNGEDGTRGRKVFSGAPETAMKSQRHFFSTLNYIHHNPVRHGYVGRWRDWPYSSADAYLRAATREEVEQRWREYPISEYGKDWDPPEL